MSTDLSISSPSEEESSSSSPISLPPRVEGQLPPHESGEPVPVADAQIEHRLIEHIRSRRNRKANSRLSFGRTVRRASGVAATPAKALQSLASRSRSLQFRLAAASLAIICISSISLIVGGHARARKTRDLTDAVEITTLPATPALPEAASGAPDRVVAAGHAVGEGGESGSVVHAVGTQTDGGFVQPAGFGSVAHVPRGAWLEGTILDDDEPR
jgi:hypothetical protein